MTVEGGSERSAPMTDAVKRARELLAKRTPGKWTADMDCFDRHDGIQAIVTDPSTTMMFSCDTGVPLHWGDGETWSDADSAKRDWNWNQAKESQAAHDAALIAAAPDLLRELCEEVERLRASHALRDEGYADADYQAVAENIAHDPRWAVRADSQRVARWALSLRRQLITTRDALKEAVEIALGVAVISWNHDAAFTARERLSELAKMGGES